MKYSYNDDKIRRLKGVNMTMTAVSIKIPETMTEYAEPKDEAMLLSRNAMILYPYIQNETISFGKAAQILGLHKMDLIALYGRLGVPYFDQTSDELENDVNTLKKLRRKVV